MTKRIRRTSFVLTLALLMASLPLSPVTAASSSSGTDLAVTLVDSADPVTDGDPLTYTAVVANLGKKKAKDVEFVQALPSAIAFSSATGAPGTCAYDSASHRVACALRVLQEGATWTVTVSGTVLTTTDETALSRVQVGAKTDDPVLHNNSDAEATRVLSQQADLAVDANGPASATQGDTLNYTVDVRNLGPQSAQATTIDITTTPGLTFDSGSVSTGGSGASCYAPDLHHITCDPFTLANAITISFSVDYDADATGTQALTASATSTTADPDTSNNSDVVQTNVAAQP
jgi:uncharacterized repeat protein (TIGR01451 family)